jgi:aminopeptidase N
VPPNLRKPFYCSIAENGGNEEWDFLWARYLASNTATEKRVLMRGMACSKNTTVLQK